MGLEWVLLSLVVAATLWLGLDARRETKRLHARLTEVRAELFAGREGLVPRS
jgi:hypothetical protein